MFNAGALTAIRIHTIGIAAFNFRTIIHDFQSMHDDIIAKARRRTPTTGVTEDRPVDGQVLWTTGKDCHTLVIAPNIENAAITVNMTRPGDGTSFASLAVTGKPDRDELRKFGITNIIGVGSGL